MESGYLEVVKYLLEQGADLHAQNDWAFQWAARNGRLEVVEYLVKHGANLHVDDDYALRWAAENGHLEMVKYLLEQGADSNLITKKMLVRLFTSYDLQIATNIPRLTSLLLKIDLVKNSYQVCVRNKILSTYKKKVLLSLSILMYHLYHLYHRPSSPDFFQAIGQI